MKGQKVTIPCPSCKSGQVEAIKTPSYLAASTSRISAKSATTYHREPEKYEIVGDCPDCGQAAKALQKIEKDGKPCDREKLIERLKAQGLPTVIRTGARYDQANHGMQII